MNNIEVGRRLGRSKKKEVQLQTTFRRKKDDIELRLFNVGRDVRTRVGAWKDSDGWVSLRENSSISSNLGFSFKFNMRLPKLFAKLRLSVL